jgi:hypothetical protein
MNNSEKGAGDLVEGMSRTAKRNPARVLGNKGKAVSIVFALVLSIAMASCKGAGEAKDKNPIDEVGNGVQLGMGIDDVKGALGYLAVHPSNIVVEPGGTDSSWASESTVMLGKTGEWRLDFEDGKLVAIGFSFNPYAEGNLTGVDNGALDWYNGTAKTISGYYGEKTRSDTTNGYMTTVWEAGETTYLLGYTSQPDAAGGEPSETLSVSIIKTSSIPARIVSPE